MLETLNLSRSFAARPALTGLSFSLPRGEVLGLLGPNGAGKSTALNLMSGVLAPSDGQITIDGIDLITHPREAKRHIGYLPELAPLHGELTVDEQLDTAARLHGLKREARTNARRRVCERLALGAFQRRLIAQLSRGQRQRVGLAQAILHAPSVILLDEPAAGLDPNQMREMRTLIRELGREHAVILSTHLLADVEEGCDRVLILDRGASVFEAPTDDLAARLATRTLRVRFRSPPSTDEIARLPGVNDAVRLDNDSLRVEYGPERDPTDILVERSIAARWGLTELVRERRNLDALFGELTERR